MSCNRKHEFTQQNIAKYLPAKKSFEDNLAKATASDKTIKKLESAFAKVLVNDHKIQDDSNSDCDNPDLLTEEEYNRTQANLETFFANAMKKKNEDKDSYKTSNGGGSAKASYEDWKPSKNDVVELDEEKNWTRIKKQIEKHLGGTW